MNEFSKVFYPFLFVILTSVVGFFITEVVKELRGSPLLTYSKTIGADNTVEFRVRNAANHFVQGIVLQIACPDERVCLDQFGRGQYANRIDAKSMIKSQNSEQVEIEINLHPRTSALLKVKPVAGQQSNVELLYRPDLIAPQVVTLLSVGGPTAFIANNYLEIMSWSFFVAGISAMVLLVVSFVILIGDVLGKKGGRSRAQSYVYGTNPNRPAGNNQSSPIEDRRTSSDQGSE